MSKALFLHQLTHNMTTDCLLNKQCNCISVTKRIISENYLPVLFFHEILLLNAAKLDRSQGIFILKNSFKNFDQRNRWLRNSLSVPLNRNPLQSAPMKNSDRRNCRIPKKVPMPIFTLNLSNNFQFFSWDFFRGTNGIEIF